MQAAEELDRFASAVANSNALQLALARCESTGELAERLGFPEPVVISWLSGSYAAPFSVLLDAMQIAFSDDEPDR